LSPQSRHGEFFESGRIPHTVLEQQAKNAAAASEKFSSLRKQKIPSLRKLKISSLRAKRGSPSLRASKMDCRAALAMTDQWIAALRSP
jgi:hypothetical protein